MVELNYGTTILGCIKDVSNKDMQISFLYALSDLVDVDDSGLFLATVRQCTDCTKLYLAATSSSLEPWKRF